MNLNEMLDTVRLLPDGDYVECGVHQGHSASIIYNSMAPGAWLWLFDTFTGHQRPGEFDDALHHPEGRYKDTSEARIRDKFPNAKVVMGPVQVTLSLLAHHPNQAHRHFRFVHIDLDHYEPTHAACAFFKSRMVKGGIIRFDDYHHSECPGATRAIDEIFGRENILTSDYRYEHTHDEMAVPR